MALIYLYNIRNKWENHERQILYTNVRGQQVGVLASETPPRLKNMNQFMVK